MNFSGIAADVDVRLVVATGIVVMTAGMIEETAEMTDETIEETDVMIDVKTGATITGLGDNIK